jgi:ArsR family transcriptional regulator, arsenate/arsenite/antimonite-responsive transcriptional repressor
MNRMAKAHKLSEEQVQAIARVLADPRRFAILQQIAGKGNMPCSGLRECQPISAATLSHHMKELAEAGLIEVEREGRTADITFRRDVWEAYLGQLANI